METDKWHKWREIKFENPKESAQNGWELNQNIRTLLRQNHFQPEELNDKDCIKEIKELIEIHTSYEAEIEARS